jgi:hypothetical protein
MKKFTAPDGSFSVMMPATPEVRHHGGDTREISYRADKSGLGLHGFQYWIRAIPRRPDVDPKKWMERYIDSVPQLSTIKATKRSITHAGYPGIDGEIPGINSGWTFVRTFATNDKLYSLLVSRGWQTKEEGLKDAGEFFDSFQLSK